VNRRPVLAVLAAAVLAVAGCASSGRPKANGSDLVGQNHASKYQGAGLIPPQPRPSFTLTDTAGQPFAFGTQTAKHPTFLYFGYTKCPDICPATMGDIAVALRKVDPKIAAQAYVVFITTDVKHDSPAVIKQWLSAFTPGSKARWIGLRGTQAQIDAAQAAAHVAVAEDDGQTHSAQALLYGPDDYAHVTFLQSTKEQQQMIHDLPVVARG
jgi:protein SCO1